MEKQYPSSNPVREIKRPIRELGECAMCLSRKVLMVVVGGLVVYGLAQNKTLAAVIGYWEFHDQPVGGNVAAGVAGVFDSSGNGHTGTPVDANLNYVVGAPGYDGEAVSIHSGGSMTVPASPQFTFDSGFTLETVFKTPVGNAEWGNIVYGAGFQMRITYSGLVNSYVDDGTDYIERYSTAAVNDGNWHQVAMVYDGTNHTLKTYIDFNPDNTGTNALVSPPISSTPIDLVFFSNPPAYSTPFRGEIDFIRISNVALDVSEFVHPTIPEPASLGLLALGALALARRRR